MDKTQWMLITWISRITGTLSFIGSSAIIYMILSDRAKKLSKPSHRLMLPLCTFDLFQSAAVAMSTLALPRSSNVYGALGNMTTCKIQVFFLALGLACPMYNASLCLLYLLTIRHRLDQRHFATKIEPFLHTASILIPLTLATLIVALDQVGSGENPICTHQSDDSPLRWFVAAIPTICFCFCVYSMVSISYYVGTQSNKMRRYSQSTKQNKRRESEKKSTVRQAIFYSLAFFITFIFPAITLFYDPFPLVLMKSVFYPLQGFWNCLLYIRPNIIKKRELEPDTCLCEIIWMVIFSPNQNAKQNRQHIGKRIDKRLQLARDNSDADISEYSKEIISNRLTGNAQINEQATQVLNNLENTDTHSRSILEGRSPLFATNTNHVEDASHFLESESNERRIEPCVVRRASLVFANLDDEDFSAYISESESSEGRVEPCVV